MRNLAQSLTTRLLRLPLQAIADVLGKDETAACRVRANERPCTLSEWTRLIDLAGYKLVGKDKQCIPEDELRMLRRCYAERHHLEDLRFEDPE